MLVYPASYFAGAQLNTAYDMVTRLPGFVFTDTNTQQRGYAGSMGNVFINGAPPASKTDVLSSVLTRIAIADVDRIEVIRGGAPGIDMQGLTVVANVILKRGGNHVIVTLADTIYGDGHQGPAASVEFNGQWGDSAYDLQLSRINSLYDDSAGNGIGITSYPQGGTVINGSHRRGAEKVGYGLNGSWVQPLLEGNLSTNLISAGKPFTTRRCSMMRQGRPTFHRAKSYATPNWAAIGTGSSARSNSISSRCKGCSATRTTTPRSRPARTNSSIRSPTAAKAFCAPRSNIYGRPR